VAVLGLTTASLILVADATAGESGSTAHRLPRPPTTTTRITPGVAHPAPEDAFDWLDAGIGGAAALGLGLVGAGTSVVVARRRQQRVLADIQTSRREQHQ
jgi:hypothetical protein